jgi:GR25 family glycosyltransferase involved in LPS biosynthesis
METELNSSGLHAQQWPAVDWEHVAHGNFDADYLVPQGISRSVLDRNMPAKQGNGTIAAFLSHVTALIEASKRLQPDDLALIMEDDINIPKDWESNLQNVVDEAPEDWELLKLSAFGTHRLADLVNKNNNIDIQEETLPLPSFSENIMNWFKLGLKIAAPAWMTTSVQEHLTDFKSNRTFWMMRGPFREAAFLNMGTHGWGTPNYFYGGAGAYLVRGSSINKVIHQLRSKPIDDVDAMMLSNGPNYTSHFYQTWPHVFELGGVAFHGPGLHNAQVFDDDTSSTDADQDQTGSKRGLIQTHRGRRMSFRGRGQSVLQSNADINGLSDPTTAEFL